MAFSLSDAGLSQLGLSNMAYDPSQIGQAFQAASMAPAMATGQVAQGFNDPTTQQTYALGGVLNALLQGSQAQTDLAISGPGGYNEQLAMQGAGYNQQAGQLAQQLGFQQQGYGIQGAGLGLQGTSLDQQLANLQAQYGLQQQGFGLQQQQLGLQGISQNAQNQLAAQQFQNQMASYGIQNAGIGAERNQVAWNTNQQGMANQQQSAASGSFGAKGYYDRAQNLWEQAMYQYGGLDRQQQQLWLSMVGAQEARTNQQVQEWVQGKGLGIQQQQLGLTEQQAAQANTYSQQQIADARQKLGLDYQSLGLSQNEAQAGYQNALNKLGLNNLMTVSQLEGEIAKAKAGQYTPVTQYLGQLIAAGAPIVA